MTICPRCTEPLASGQEYCLACGARMADSWRGTDSTMRSDWGRRALATGLVALVGAVAAVAVTGSDADAIPARQHDLEGEGR